MASLCLKKAEMCRKSCSLCPSDEVALPKVLPRLTKGDS
jgi:hypothetical protein